VVIEQTDPGAAGNFGMEAGAKSPPDGYTLLAAPNGNLVVNPHMYSKLSYDVFKDLAPVTRIAAVQNVLVVNPEVPASSMKELVALASRQAGHAQLRLAGQRQPGARRRRAAQDAARTRSSSTCPTRASAPP
jgi:tripartite-type tricarboxylate transporter receptor subunit TctC